ncbi:MAG: CDP-alcohol phosphatidyltransferase family protein [Anaerolineae bacterium]|nr:CDP-alcohol phosphatidyltransferase family protein [Anaerolineae bacterium]
MTQQKKTRQFNTLTDLMRYLTRGLTTRIGHRLYVWGVHPDFITFTGLVIVAGAAFVAAHGEFFWAAVIILAGTPLDAVDGAVARAMQRQDKFGALWDSTLDRYADGFIFMGLAYYYSDQQNQTAMLLSMSAMLGSILVSYVRARAEGLNLDCKVGLFTRMERVIVILAMLVTGWVIPGLWILAIGTHFTVLQRVWYVNRSMQRQRTPTNEE